MDIKINGIGFHGKKEVIYGLTKAAQKAKDIEYYSQPVIASKMTTDKLIAGQEASMNAYMDMALRDESFEKTVHDLKLSELYYLVAVLKPEQTQYSVVRPMNKFKQSIALILGTIGKARSKVEPAVDELYKQLGL